MPDRARRARVALVVHDIAPFGGMDRALRELVERASDRFEFVVFSRSLVEDLRPLVEWHRVPVPARPIPLKFALFFALAALRLARAKVDLVSAVGAIVPNRLDIALVHHSHTGWRRAIGTLTPADGSLSRRVNTSILRALSMAAERWCYRSGRVSELIAVSKGLASELRRDFMHVPVTVIPNGVDSDRFSPDPEARKEVRSELGVGTGEIVVLFIGGDWAGKGLALAISAVAHAGGESLQLWVVGRGNARAYAARASELMTSVRFLGPREDAERLYSAADIFVLPSLYETFSLVAYEAAASGLPVIATKVSGVDELIQAGAGIHVEHRADSIGGALTRLASDADLRRRLGESGRRIAHEYTWQRSVEATIELFERVLAEKHSQSVHSRPVSAAS